LLDFLILGSVDIQIGGFTCKVGDPSGRLTDREKMSPETANTNIQRITRQLKSLFLNIRAYASPHGYNESEFGKLEMMNNTNWWTGFKFSDFLTNVASYMRMGPMLARESVKVRLQSPEGIDAASFLYQSLQAYDFYHLFSTRNCQLQIGGSDQWGNITAGIDLCQKIEPSDTKCALPICLS
jgi:tyrosyl-tRNA synthetase